MSQVEYFKATKIAEDSYLIQYAFTDRENTCCYLVIGRDKAMVIDTMFGFGHLRAFCETLTDKPLQLVNTHYHFDHCAGNFEFDACWMHHRDIEVLLKALNRLISKGHTVIIIEHNPAVIVAADHVIDLGPEGGTEGGDIVCTGTPEEIAQCQQSYTGKYIANIIESSHEK